MRARVEEYGGLVRPQGSGGLTRRMHGAPRHPALGSVPTGGECTCGSVALHCADSPPTDDLDHPRSRRRLSTMTRGQAHDVTDSLDIGRRGLSPSGRAEEERRLYQPRHTAVNIEP